VTTAPPRPLLYDCATAPSPRRARILLAEKGVAHDTVQVDLRSGEQLGAAYRRINPLCTVPALRTEEGAVLTDNAAIAAYLEARHPEPPLLGRTPLEKAEIAGWQARIEFEGLMAVAEALRNGSLVMANMPGSGPVDYAQIPALAERGLVRPLLGPERKALREERHQITCFNCGAPADGAGDTCAYCHTALVVLDLPQGQDEVEFDAAGAAAPIADDPRRLVARLRAMRLCDATQAPHPHEIMEPSRCRTLAESPP